MSILDNDAIGYLVVSFVFDPMFRHFEMSDRMYHSILGYVAEKISVEIKKPAYYVNCEQLEIAPSIS
jgi:hypothetical protein